MLLNSVPPGAKANDGIAGIKIALQIEAIESCLRKFRPLLANAFPHLATKKLCRRMHSAGFGLHLPIAAHIETNLVMEVKQSSPRNPRSKIPPAQQLQIFEAAEAKRKRKELQRAIDAGSGEALL